MHKILKASIGAGLSLGLILGILLIPGSLQAQEDFLNGRVQYFDQEGPLSGKLSRATADFKQNSREGLFFTAYIFESRHSIRMGRKWDESHTYHVGSRNHDIKIRRNTQGKQGYSVHTEDQSGPVTLLILNQFDGKQSRILDLHLLDMNSRYEFASEPVYWLGQSDVAESMSYLIDEFESGKDSLKEDLLFAIGSHDSPKSGEFLFRTAKSRESIKVRKSAIFWIGNMRDSKSMEYLREIYSGETENRLKEQVVFALTLVRDPEADKEIIRIARTEANGKVKKSAIFWLGQKASEESIKYLKGVVESGDEDGVKDSAVFAISQLPKEKSVPMLIDIAQNNKSASVRKKAIFWLGQTGDEKALEFFEKILLKK